MAIHIADAYVEIEAKDQTQADVDEIMDRLRSLGPVEIELQVKDETREESERIMRRLEGLGPVEIALQIDDQTASGIAAVEARLRSLRSVDVGLRLDDQTGADLAAFRARMASLGSHDVRLGLDVDDAALEALRARLQALGPFQVQIELELDPWAIDNIRGRLAALRGVSVPIDAHFDGHAGLAAAWTEFERFRLLSSRLLNIPVTAHDNLNVGLGHAYAEMLMFRQLAEHALRIPITVHGPNFPPLGGAGGAGAGEAFGRGQMIAAAVVAAFPAIAVAAAGAVTLAFGAAFAALPVMAWKSSTEVKEAYSGLWTDAKRGLREMTPAWEHEVAGWTGILREVGASWSPLLKETFENIRPALTTFFGQFGHGLDALKPMIKSMGEAFPALLAKLGPQMGEILGGLGNGFKALMDGITAHPEMFGQLLIDIAGLVEMIGKLGQASMALLPAIDPLYGIVGDLNNGIDNTTSAVGHLTGALDGLDGVLGKGFGSGFLSQIWSLGKTAMAVANGPVAVGIYSWQKYKEATEGLEGGGVIKPALEAMRQAAIDAAGGTEYLTATQSGLVDIMKTASMTADELKDALDRLTKTNLDQWDSLTAAEAAIDKMTKSIAQNGHTLDANTKAGQKNRDMLSSVAKKFQDYIEKMKGNKEPTEKVAAEAERLRKKFYDFALSLTHSKKRAEELTESMLGIAAAAKRVPAKTKTQILGEISDLQKKLNTAKAQLRSVPASKRSKLLGDIADLQAKIREARGQLASLHDKVVNVTIRTTSASRVAQENVGAGNADGNVWVPNAFGSVRAFAQGAENHVAQIARPGEYRLWAEDETGGEAYIPLSQSKRARSLAILEDVARRFGVMVARPMEDGGLLSFTSGGIAGGGKGAIDQAIAATKAAAVRRKLFAEIEAAGKKLIAGITKAMMSSLDKVNAYAEKLNEMIKKYLSGAQEKSMLKWAGAIEAKMRAAATSAEELAATIKEAKEFAASTAKTLVGGSGIGSLGAIGNAQDVKGGLQFRAGEMQRFADQLGQLAKLGLNKDSILEIVGYGPQQGGALADMLLKDTSTFAAINSAQSAIAAAAGNIGNLAADQMYDTGAHAADGFLTGLYAKQKELSALMSDLGEQLAAGIKKVLAEAKAATKAKVSPKSAIDAAIDEMNKAAEQKKLKKGSAKDYKKPPKGRAIGGIVEAGEPYLVGEEGIELITPSSRGWVHTASETAGMLSGGITVGSLHINITGVLDLTDPQAAERLADLAGPAIQEKLRILERSKR